MLTNAITDQLSSKLGKGDKYLAPPENFFDPPDCVGLATALVAARNSINNVYWCDLCNVYLRALQPVHPIY